MDLEWPQLLMLSRGYEYNIVMLDLFSPCKRSLSSLNSWTINDKGNQTIFPNHVHCRPKRLYAESARVLHYSSLAKNAWRDII